VRGILGPVPRPTTVRTQQSCARASNDDHRNAAGHRGSRGPHRLRHGPAAARVRPGRGTLRTPGAAPGRQHRATTRPGTRPGGPATRRTARIPAPDRAPGRPGGPHDAPADPPGPRAARAAAATAEPALRRPSPPPRAAPGPRAPASATATARRSSLRHPHGAVEPRRLRPRQAVRRLAPGQSRGTHLRPDIRPLTPQRAGHRTQGCPAIPGGRATPATASRHVVGPSAYAQHADVPRRAMLPTA
jgi:hypothetical protein